ncbi:DUF6612 family protein [Virgibacillus byunsanensis]|uniref:DUF6612 family protein n=1 Tax=Virgibacillus byunsanensis TaxID=570945 RepID=A0ABW3LN24_9BACI
MNNESYSSLFHVIDNGDHYVLSYSGSDEEFKSIVFGANHTMQNAFFNDFFHNMLITGTYELTINKETFYLTIFELDFIATTSGAAGEGEINESSDFSFSNLIAMAASRYQRILNNQPIR